MNIIFYVVLNVTLTMLCVIQQAFPANTDTCKHNVDFFLQSFVLFGNMEDLKRFNVSYDTIRLYLRRG